MSDHDASSSALGYMYQVKWALLELVRGAHTRPDQTLTLESLDDIGWQSDSGSVKELLQLKHHKSGASGDLTDTSSDVWRTLKVWLDDARFMELNGPVLSIVTTSEAPFDSAMSFLRPEERDEDEALRLLNSAATESRSLTTEVSRSAWLLRTEAERRGLLSRVRVLDLSTSIEGVDELVRRALGVAIPIGFENIFLDRIWAWWFRVAVDLLAKRRTWIDGLTFHRVVSNIRDQFAADNLVTTVDDSSEYDQQKLMGAHGGRLFVQQLGWLGLRQRQVEKAVLDYHRAITQTTDWIDGNLLQMKELEIFKERLIDEWENSYDDMLNRLPEGATENDKSEAGRELFVSLRDSPSVQIRDKYTDSFYSRGSRCEIADGGTHGWHPDFEELIRSITVERAEPEGADV